MEFLDLGKHCEHPGCNQHDFLPFKCDSCSKVFCLQHRSYRTHECPVAGSRDTHAIECPICAGSIRVTGTEDVNVAFERHSKSLCNPARRKQRKHKKRCGAAHCHKKLTLTNTVTCDVCRIEVCLTHRYPDAHSCVGAAASRNTSRRGFLSRFSSAGKSNNVRGAAASKPKPKPKPKPQARRTGKRGKNKWGQQTQDPANTLRGSAARRMRGADAARMSASTAAPAPAVGAGVPVPRSVVANAGTGREVCPTCGARFQRVTELVSHVESWHGSGSGAVVAAPAPATATAGAGSQPATRTTAGMPCPKCGASFFDAVQLVEHCESGRCPQTRRQSSCLVS